MADLTDVFEGSLKPSRSNGAEINRNRPETSMKPSETKVAGHKRNRETAPLQGRSLVSPPVALQRAVGRACPVRRLDFPLSHSNIPNTTETNLCPPYLRNDLRPHEQNVTGRGGAAESVALRLN